MFGQVPNITGNFQGYRRVLTVDAVGGAFEFFGDNGYDWTPSLSEIINKKFGVIFNASSYSDVYSGTSMQPKALSILPCIRF